MADNTVFDSVFKTMVHKMPQLLVPFVNEAFGRNYAHDEEVVSFKTEYEVPKGTIIDDAVFRIGDKIYHIECQSTADTYMAIRMIEYDFAIALEEALADGAPYEIDFPESCVLYLRHTTTTPDVLEIKVNLPNGEWFLYQARVFKAQRIDRDELFEKRLLILMPYYLMRYETSFAQIAQDDDLTSKLLTECGEIRSELELETIEEGDALLYEQLVELIIRVTDHVLEKHETLRKKVRRAMGGEILELMQERAERMEREARAKGHMLGRAEGRKEGREQGRKEGREEGRAEGLEEGRELEREEVIGTLVQKLREQGIDESVIQASIEAIRLERANAAAE